MIINMVVNIYASTIEHYLTTNCIYLQLHQPLFMAEPLLAQTKPKLLYLPSGEHNDVGSEIIALI